MVRDLLITTAGLLALALVFSVSSCRHEAGKVQEAREALAVERAKVDGCATALDAVNANTADAVADAARRAAKGEGAAQRAVEAAEQAKARQGELSRQLQEAKRLPSCAEQLRVELCPAIPLH